MFRFLPVPEPLARINVAVLGQGAKLCYGRLARYAGEDGKCYPSLKTLAAELGASRAQAKRYLRELREYGLIRIQGRRSQPGDSDTNEIFFLWHPVLEPSPSGEVAGGADTHPPGGVTSAPPVESDVRPKDSPVNKSSSGREDLDIDCSKRKSGVSSASLPPSKPKRYPALQARLTRYMRGHVRVTDRACLEIMVAVPRWTEGNVLWVLDYLENSRGLKYGTENGPRTMAWFPVAMKDFSERQRRLDDAVHPDPEEIWDKETGDRL
jgi:hypothetical protein